jgi:peptide/nickel transport system permease protein
MLVERLPATAMLATAALVVAVALAIPLGIAAAVHRDSWIDRTAMAFAALGLAIPNFCLGPLLIVVFSIQLGVTPVTGDVGLRGLILPALTLGTGLAAALARMIRASLLTSLGQNFVRTARAKGLTEARVILRHALGNALLPVVTVFGMQLGALLGGAVITEIVFAWPGIGLLTIESIQRRDYPTVQACVLVIALGYVAVNTLTDLVYAWLDPRIRLS